MNKKPLVLVFYDDTCRGKRFRPGLTHCWITGGLLYRALGRFDHIRGVTSWLEGLQWLSGVEPEREIAEVQFWGHGEWGSVLVDRECLDERVLSLRHPLFGYLESVRARFCGPKALWWFRTCETFGSRRGQAFAEAWTSHMGCRGAGHTFRIGPWQSGLHSLEPSHEPHWSASEGLPEGSDPDAPKNALWSHPARPNTINCFNNKVPAGF